MRCIEIMGLREGMWDANKVGIAGPPIKVGGGWPLSTTASRAAHAIA